MIQARLSVGKSRMSLALVLILFIGCSSAVDQLAKELQQGDNEQKYSAVRRLEELAEQGSDLGDALPALQSALTDEDAKIRYRALKSLSKMPSIDGLGLDLVAQIMLEDEDPDLRYYAAKVIYNAGDARNVCLAKLLQALKTKNREDVLCYVVKSLGKIGADAKPALGRLSQLSQSDSPELQKAALKAIRRIREATTELASSPPSS